VVDLKWLTLPGPLIAKRGDAADRKAPTNGIDLARLERAAYSVKLELGQRQHDAQHQASGRRGQVEAVLDSHERPVGSFDALYGREAMQKTSGEAVQAGDDDTVSFPRLDRAYKPL